MHRVIDSEEEKMTVTGGRVTVLTFASTLLMVDDDMMMIRAQHHQQDDFAQIGIADAVDCADVSYPKVARGASSGPAGG